jgi:4-carboxymuconolactone decarboxylase
VVTTPAAGAQERFATLSPDQMTPEQKRVADAILNGPRKKLSGPFNVWLRSPVLADRLQAVGEYLRFSTSIDHRLNEFAILIAARFWTAQYEWYAHYPLAMKAGLRPEIAAELAQGKRPSGMRADEALVYDICTQLHDAGNLTDTTYAAAVAAFGENGVVDLIAVSGYYDIVSMTLNVAKLGVPEGQPPLPELPRPARGL